MSKKLIGLIVVLVLGGLLFATVTHSPEKDNPIDRRMTSRTTPAARSVAVREAENNAVPAEDWLIEPGNRIGSITARTKLADLQKLFGEKNVKVAMISGPEGSQFDGVILFPEQPEKALELIWKEGSNPKTVSVARLQGTKSVWHTAQGISLGTPLAKLETLNQGPFTLSGFDWDYGGTVLSWGDQGKLRSRFQQNGGLILRLTLPENTDGELHRQVSGDQTFSSSHPAMRKLNPTVDQIQVMLQ